MDEDEDEDEDEDDEDEDDDEEDNEDVANNCSGSSFLTNSAHICSIVSLMI